MKLTFLLLLIITNLTTIFGANYYCDPVNGTMSNNGSLASPWGSLEAVFNQGVSLNGGDKLILLNGNHGFPKIVGTNSSNVEIIPHTGHSPTINRIQVGNTLAASYWLLNGLTIESENISQYPKNLIDLYPNSSNITIVNCTITSNSNTSSWSRNDWRTKANNGILSKGTGHKFNYNTIKNVAIGLSMLSDFSQFIGNTIQYFTIDGIRGLGNDCSYIDNTIKDNISVYYYYENHYDGFQSFSSTPSVGNGTVSNVIIKRNTIINCTDNSRQFRGSMQGIGCFDGMYHNWTIENNVIIVDNWHGITLAGATNCRIINNTIIDPYDVSYQDPNDPQQFGNVGPAWIRITAHKTDGGTNSGTLSTNNTIINNLTPVMQNDNNIGTVSNNIILGASSNYSSFFVNSTNFDLHLLASSSAIDSGTLNGAPNSDIENTTRPQGLGIDIGAYEWQSACNISFQILTSSSTICEGESITLTTNYNTTATWDNNVIDNVAFYPTNTQTYTATVSNGICSHQEQVTINVVPPPFFAISLWDPTLCLGEDCMITASGNTFPVFWNNGISDGVPFTPQTTLTYIGTSSNNACSYSDSISVIINSIPIINISQDGNIIIADNNNGNLQWLANGTVLNGETNDTLNFYNNGNYEVFITDSNGCSSTSNQLSIQDVSIVEAKKFKTYISTSSGYLYIKTLTKIERLNIYNLNGQLVISSKSNNPVNIIKLKTGVYLAHIQTYNNVETIRFYIE